MIILLSFSSCPTTIYYHSRFVVPAPQLAGGQILCCSHMWVAFTAFISISVVPAGFSVNHKNSLTLWQLINANITSSAPFLSLSLPFLFSVIC